MKRYQRDEIESAKYMIQEFIDWKLIDETQLCGLKIVQMDRAELLGMICFLLRHPSLYKTKDEK